MKKASDNENLKNTKSIGTEKSTDSKINEVNNILFPIGLNANNVTLITWKEILGNEIAGSSNLSDLADIVINGDYVPKPRPLKPDRIRSEPLEPTSTNDVILDTRARITYRTEKEVWDAAIEEYTSNMIVYNELLKSWAVYEESTRRKFPQVYIKIHNHLSKESKDLIKRTYLTTFEYLDGSHNRRDTGSIA